MKFSVYALSLFLVTAATSQFAWSGDTKTYPRDYFETHQQKVDQSSGEDRTTASVSKDESAPAQADEMSSFHEGTGPSGKYFGGKASRF